MNSLLSSKGNEPVEPATAVVPLAFRWRYIALPLAVLLLSVVLVVYFYQRLPVELTYQFQSDGSPDRWVSRGALLLWMLLPQLLFTLMAGVITWGMTKLAARYWQPESTGIKAESILLLMGNMVALPQIVLCFAMLNIFVYNAYQIRLLPLWVFALIIMALGGVGLGILFVRTIRQVWGAHR